MTNSNIFSHEIKAAIVALFLAGQIASAQTTPAPRESAAPSGSGSRLAETERRQGPFLLAGRDFFVVLHSICLSGARGQGAQETLVGVTITDIGGYVLQQETFPYEVVDGHFTRTLTASAALFAGRGGSALAIEFFETRPHRPLQQSWQMFGVVNSRLEQFGLPLPVGQSATVGGVVTAVMVQGGIAVVPMASTAEPLELPVWTGHFYAGVQVRMDWARAKWSQGVQCFASGDGKLRENGCNMNVEASLQPGADFSAVLLSPEPRENSYTVRYVPVRSGAQVEILGTRGIVNWQENEGRVQCTLSDLWLRVRINGVEGWVNRAQAFAALGLPGGNVSE